MNQLWRRNIKKADKAGVEVALGDRTDLKAFHDLYVHTAERDHFTPRPLSYFETMYDALAAEDPDRIQVWLARHEGDLVAATIGIRVGTHAWYSYGASSTEKREVRGSNAVQWAMMRHALDAGADLELDQPDVGVVGVERLGDAAQVVDVGPGGEWDLPLNRAIYKAFDLYMSRRG